MSNNNKISNRKFALIYLALVLTLIIFVLILIRIPAVNEKLFVAGICRYYNLFATSFFSYVNFSAAEILIMSAALTVLALLISVIVLLIKKNKKTAFKIGLGLINFVLSIILLYTAVTSPLYKRSDMYSALGLNFTDNTEEMAESAIYYNNELNKLSLMFERDEEGNIICPYSENELIEIIENEMKTAVEEFDYFYKSNGCVKVFFTSSITNYFSISGMYLSLTGESNVCRVSPAYILPSIIAHELAHSKGIMRENDANFLAYYALICSKNDYLRYSGLMKAASITLNALYGSDYYFDVYEIMSEQTKREYKNAAAFYAKYDGIISVIGEKINDLYLKSNGESQGIKSYSQTQKALSALYHTKLK